jgi:hypothetical protein
MKQRESEGKPPQTTKIIQVRFPVEVWEAIKQLAYENDRSFNGEVIHVLRDYISQRQTGQQGE